MNFIEDVKFWATCPQFTSTQIEKIQWHCGEEQGLGVNEVSEWQDWSDRETTPDQERIEDYLSTLNLNGRKLLHVGVGNSKLAEKFSAGGASVDGITIETGEYQKGLDRGLSNYRVFLLNKYSADMPEVLQSSYDFIIDNNPSTFACCRKHFFTMMKNYYVLLNPGGEVLTDKLGLSWYTSLNNPLWGLTVEEWFKLGGKMKFQGIQHSEWVVGLQKQ